MFTVALIGGDGAGKTTIAHKLLDSFPLRMKYLYMGMNIDSSNVALPTSRLIYFLKNYRNKKSLKNWENTPPEKKHNFRDNRASDTRGKIGASARLLYRLSEEWYRQLAAWFYRLRGYIVLCDRHFLFEFAPIADSPQRNNRLSERVHNWLLGHFYARPDLVIFLDAPAEVLYQRKREASIEYLNSKRMTYLQQGEKLANFIRVDAAQSAEKVYAEVSEHIMEFYMARQSQRESVLSEN
jgi:thymidylate kinase